MLGGRPGGYNPPRAENGRPARTGASPAFVIRGGRIAWRIELFVPLDLALRCPVFAGDADAAQNGWERFLGRVEDVKRGCGR